MVCLGSRGNAFSRRHVALAPEQTAFWDFSWDELAAGDLPALINYVLATTGQVQVAYVGAPPQDTRCGHNLSCRPWRRCGQSNLVFGPGIVRMLFSNLSAKCLTYII